MLPEVFETDVHSAGKCRRIQVVSHAVLASWIKIRPSQTTSITYVAFWALFSPHHVPQLQTRNVCARSKQVPGSAASCLAARRLRQADIYTLPKLPVAGLPVHEQHPATCCDNVRSRTISAEQMASLHSAELVSVTLQVPLKLAWALTIHKCQGLTLDYARISLKASTYREALSKAKSLPAWLASLSHVASPLKDIIFIHPSCTLRGMAKAEGVHNCH